LEASDYTAYTFVQSKASLNLSLEVLNGVRFYNDSVVEFKIKVNNPGLNTLYNLTVTDVIPYGMVFNNASPANSSGSANKVIWNFSNITGGEVKTIYLNLTVTDNTLEGAHNNYVEAEAYRCGVTYKSNNVVEFEVLSAPEIFVVKDASSYSVTPGDNVSFSIYFSNPSNVRLYNISITDILPVGFMYVRNSSKVNGANYTASMNGIDANVTGNYSIGENITWNLSIIPSKSFNVLTFDAVVKCDVNNSFFFNKVNISAYSWNGSMVSANDSLKMQGSKATVKIYKTHSDYKPSFFDYVTYSVVIRNNASGGNVQGINFSDYLPVGLKYINNSLRIGDIVIYGTSNESNGTQTMNLYDCPVVDTNCTVVGKITGNYSIGTNISLNLTGYVFLKPWEQITLSYTVQVMPNVNSSISNHADVVYLDPVNPIPDQPVSYESSDKVLLLPPSVSDETNCSVSCTNIINYTQGSLECFVLHLRRGWNLVSFPLNFSNSSIFSVLKDIDGKYTDIYAYGFDWNYKVYAYDMWFGDLSSIDPARGYWINMKEDVNLSILGYTLKNASISLHPGWNLIGYPYLQSKPLDEITVQIDSEYTDIYTYDSSTNDWVYRVYAYGTRFGSLNEMEPGKGYWIKMKNATTMKF